MFIAWPHSSLIVVRGFMGAGHAQDWFCLRHCHGSWYPYAVHSRTRAERKGEESVMALERALAGEVWE